MSQKSMANKPITCAAACFVLYLYTNLFTEIENEAYIF